MEGPKCSQWRQLYKTIPEITSPLPVLVTKQGSTLDLKKSQTQVHPEPMSWVEKLPDLAEMGTESEGRTGEPIPQPCRADPRQRPSHSPAEQIHGRADPRQRPSHSPAERIHGSAHLTALQGRSTAALIPQPCRADPRQCPSHSPAERIHGSALLSCFLAAEQHLSTVSHYRPGRADAPCLILTPSWLKGSIAILTLQETHR